MRAGARALAVVLPLAAAIAWSAGGSAQQPSFRVSTELVVVDVSVVSKDGTPVKGLEASDFTVRVDGQPRRVRSVKYVDQSISEPGGAATAVRRLYSSNETEATGRLILIVVDELSIRFGGLMAAAQSVERLLAGFGPSDKIAIATLPGPRMLVEFTRDRGRVASAIKAIPGGMLSPSSTLSLFRFTVGEAFGVERSDSTIWQEVLARECSVRPPIGCDTELRMELQRRVSEERGRTDEFASAFRALLQALAGVDAPKLVIVFSEGFASPEAASQLAFCGPAAMAARAVVYGMRLDPSMFDAASQGRTFIPAAGAADDRQSAIAALDALAGAARGTTFEIIGSAEIPFKRLAAEVSGYYLLGVEPEGRDRDGKPHQIAVGVGRPGLAVRARREFASRPAVTDEKKLMNAALASPLAVSDIPLRVATFTMADEDPAKVRVLVVGEVDRGQQKDGGALVSISFTDETGKMMGSIAQRMTLPRADTGALSLVLSTTLAPAPYTMKLAVVREGQAGSVEHTFVARLTVPEPPPGRRGTGVQLGQLVVAAPAATAQKLVPAIDSLVRGDRFVSFVQLGVDPKTRDDVDLVFDVVKAESGPALLSAPAVLEPAPKGRTRIAEAVVDARLLPPGEYGVRLTVASAGAPVATLFTPFVLERPRATLGGGKGLGPAAPGPGGSPPADAVRFRREDVLEQAVLAPFLEEVARYSPASARPALDLARTGRLEEAAQKAQPGAAGDPAPAFLRGLSLLSKGELDPAAIAFREAIATQPELLVGAFYIGACYAAGRKDTNALNAWQTSLVALDRYPAVYRFMGDAMIRLGQSERARLLLADAVARWPDDEALGRRVARATFETGRYTKALEYADQLIERQPTDTSVLFLAMRSAFQALVEESDLPPDALLARLRKYRDLYAAAGGLQQALVDEWVRFAERKSAS